MQQSADLFDAIKRYRTLVNETQSLRKLLKGWEPALHIKCNDASDEFHARFGESYLSEIERGHPTDQNHVVQLEAKHDQLLAIFTGKANPAKAFVNGNLAVFASGQDQVKLDAISLILWGV